MAQSKFEYVNAFNWFFLTILRLWAHLTALFFFRQKVVTGKDNIPMDAPVIFLVNHQSAFLDPVLIGISCGRKPWYLTRAGVFANPLIRYILRAIHMLPVYRLRDKVDIRLANESTFDECVKILAGNGSLLIFPEGNHGMQKRLRTPLRKGFARIALTTLSTNEGMKDIYIVPVGLNYEHPTKFRTEVLIRYGKPVAVTPFMAAYRENKPNGLNLLTRKCEEALSKEMIDIQPQNEYDEIEKKWMAVRYPFRDLQARFNADKQLIASGKFVSPLTDGPSKSKKWLLGVFGFPVFLMGLILNLPLYLMVKGIVRLLVQDPHFSQSFKFVLCMTIAPLYVAGIGVLIGNWFGISPLWGMLASLASGILGYDYHSLILKKPGPLETRLLMKGYIPKL